MKLKILKILFDFLYLGILFVMVFLTFGVSGFWLNPSGKPTLLDGIIIKNFELSNRIFSAYILSLWLMVYVVYLLRETITALRSGAIFTNVVVRNFKRCGICTLLWIFTSELDLIFYSFFADKRFTQDMKVNYGLIFFGLIIGLFFIVLSEIFKKAQYLKEENELTI